MAMRGLQVTLSVLRVMSLFLENKGQPWWCGAVARALQIRKSDASLLLHRLRKAGWLSARLEAAGELSDSQMTRRKLYRLTERGESEMRAALAKTRIKLIA